MGTINSWLEFGNLILDNYSSLNGYPQLNTCVGVTLGRYASKKYFLLIVYHSIAKLLFLQMHMYTHEHSPLILLTFADVVGYPNHQDRDSLVFQTTYIWRGKGIWQTHWLIWIRRLIQITISRVHNRVTIWLEKYSHSSTSSQHQPIRYPPHGLPNKPQCRLLTHYRLV